MKKVIRGICLVMAFLFLGIGIAGTILPILPTTPFFLLAAALFAKGSGRFHQWFCHTGLYEKYIRQALYKKEMTRQAKNRVMLMLSLLFLIGIIFSPAWYARIIIVVIACAHLYYFLVKVRSVDEEPEDDRPAL